jgi:predicted DNA-binding transcriptional regulator YafY
MQKLEERYRVIIDYTNHRGERSEREIIPAETYWVDQGENQYHPRPQYLLHAFDIKKNAWRDFAHSQIHSWKPKIT